ncbi:GFA family protein [Rhodovibrio salinarum]|nr:GFA family protein [Rhodovibrio salinarum]
MMEGGCQCGAVRYAVDAEPYGVFVCHCTQCRRQSASAFGISVDIPASALHVLQGTTQSWCRPTPTGRLICHFCPTCGGRLWHVADPPDGRMTLKGGTLDVPLDLTAAVHIWTTHKLPGVIIPEGAVCYPGEPEDR